MEPNDIQVEILEQLKLLVALTQQNSYQKANDTFNIKSQLKASKLLGIGRGKLVKAINKNKIKKDIDYHKTDTGRYHFSDYLEQNHKGRI